MSDQKDSPMVTRIGLGDMQVCVPATWTDEQIVEYANRVNGTGLDHGWSIRRQGDEALAGEPERQPCANRTGYVHVMLDC